MDRNVTVTLNVAGDQAARGTRAAADGIRNLATEEKRYHDQQRDRFRGLQPEPFAGGSGGAGMLRGALPIAAAVGAFKLAEHGVSSLANVINTMKDPLATTAQKFESLRDNLIPGHKALREFAEAINGVAATITRNAERLHVAEVTASARGKFEQVSLAGNLEHFGLGARAQQLRRGAGDVASLTLPDAAPRTIAGVRALEEAQAVLPYQRSGIMARAQVSAIGRQESYAGGQLRAERDELKQLVEQRNEAARTLNALRAGEQGPGGERQKAAIDTAATRYKELEFQAREKNNRVLETENRLKDLATQKSQALAQAQQAELSTLKARQQIHVAEVARVKGQMQSFGAMQRGDQFFALQASERLKKVGFKNLAPEERAILSQAGFGEHMGLEAMKAAEKDPMYQHIRKNLGMGGADLAQMERRAAAMSVEVEAKIALDESRLAEQLADKLGPIIKAVVATVRRQAEAGIEADRVGRIQRRNLNQ